ncbi:REEP1_2_3_4 [Lepeophtheirus salmonis]|uniref:Receptor expression-enhancing protein n=1 Tax=Lepeophtheirus salmonis TaxID=72036 RepID=A0A7R8D3C0_LEPSM|nr:REEP1_2_3_4 [Lepeophtheirus salmonis]CAF3015302.1 REEP1_2_3_4 [Lepeophtheirus salmonis]
MPIGNVVSTAAAVASRRSCIFGSFFCYKKRSQQGQVCRSYLAVRTKNVREYVKWMMYWIVFSIYTGIESFSDIFISFWFPFFYYEIKIVFLMWLLSPVAKGSLGSSIMYRKFVHPILLKKEEEIDKYVSTIGDQGYKTFWKYANEGFNFITRMVMQTAIKGGGGLITHLKRSYSLSDLATLDLCGSDTEEKRPITIQSLQEVDTGKVMVVREGKDNENQKRVNLVRRGPPTYLSVLGEVLDTEDYEVYDPRIHRRYTPISRNGSATSSVTGPQPGSHTRRKKEVSPYGTLPRSYALRKQVRKTVK